MQDSLRYRFLATSEFPEHLMKLANDFGSTEHVDDVCIGERSFGAVVEVSLPSARAPKFERAFEQAEIGLFPVAAPIAA